MTGLSGSRTGAATGKPFLKWAGGKTKLLRLFEPLYPVKFTVYHEPFMGAAAVFFHQRALGMTGPAHLSDASPELVEVFIQVRDRLSDLLVELKALAANHSDEAYYLVRDRFNGGKSSATERAAMFIYLNKTGYNGLYRVNSKNEFNVPLGRYVNPNIRDEPVLRRAAEMLAGTTIECRDFDSVIRRARKGDFVYFDPPYDPITATANFTSYAAKGFRRPEQERLAETFAALDRKGVKVMLSNHDTPTVRELYRNGRYDYRVVAHVRRAINSRGDRRSATVAEVVVRNYQQ